MHRVHYSKAFQRSLQKQGIKFKLETKVRRCKLDPSLKASGFKF